MGHEKDFEPMRSGQLPSPYHLLAAIDSMHLKYRFCQIYADTHKLHGGPLLSVDWSITLPVWHLMPSGEERSLPLLLADSGRDLMSASDPNQPVGLFQSGRTG